MSKRDWLETTVVLALGLVIGFAVSTKVNAGWFDRAPAQQGYTCYPSEQGQICGFTIRYGKNHMTRLYSWTSEVEITEEVVRQELEFWLGSLRQGGYANSKDHRPYQDAPFGYCPKRVNGGWFCGAWVTKRKHRHLVMFETRSNKEINEEFRRKLVEVAYDFLDKAGDLYANPVD